MPNAHTRKIGQSFDDLATSIRVVTGCTHGEVYVCRACCPHAFKEARAILRAVKGE